MAFDANLLKELHLERIPQPRYDVPVPRASIEDGASLINHRKAMACVDALETAAFERFIPSSIVIDTSLDAHSFIPGWSFAICVPTDRPAPVNRKVTYATGITEHVNRENQFIELAIWLKRAYEEYGARAMSAPLIWRTGGYNGTDGRPTVPMLGASVIFDRRSAVMNDVGVLADKSEILVPDPRYPIDDIEI